MKSAAATRAKLSFMCKALIATLILTAGLTATVKAQVRDENNRFVNQMYLDLLGRPVDPRSQATMQSLSIAGASRGQMADIVLTSQEYRARQVQTLYGSLLNREPEREELIPLLNLLNFGGTDEDTTSRIVASADYLTRSGGTADGFINQLYIDLLGRNPRPEEMGIYVRFLQSGGTREQAGGMITSGREYQTRLIASWCERFQRRGCDPEQAARFLTLLRMGGTDEQVISILMDSNDYAKKAGR
jgi:Domain of unknown function (DUF4214)